MPHIKVPPTIKLKSLMCESHQTNKSKGGEKSIAKKGGG